MTTFPVTSSILSSNHLVSFVKDTYKLSAGTKCKILKTGINHSYLIEDGDVKYVFRVYCFNWRTEKEILEEIRMLNLLKENEVSVSYAVKDTSGNYIQIIEAPEGQRFAVLFTFAEGEKLRELTEENCYDIGSLMGNIHQLTLDKPIDRIQYDASTLLKTPYSLTKKHIPESLDEMVFVKNVLPRIETEFTSLHSDQLRQGIIHLDIWYDNMSVSTDGQITLFDFDFCGNGPLVCDIAYTIMQLFHTEPDKALFHQKKEKFMQGYQSILPITDKEKKLIPLAGLAVWIFYMGVQAQRYDDWTNLFFSKNYVKRYIGMAKSWLEFNEVGI